MILRWYQRNVQLPTLARLHLKTTGQRCLEEVVLYPAAAAAGAFWCFRILAVVTAGGDADATSGASA